MTYKISKNRLNFTKFTVSVHTGYYEFRPGDKIVFSESVPDMDMVYKYGWDIHDEGDNISPPTFTVKEFIPPSSFDDLDLNNIEFPDDDNTLVLAFNQPRVFGTIILEEFPELEVTDIHYNVYPAELTPDEQYIFDGMLDDYLDSLTLKNKILVKRYTPKRGRKSSDPETKENS
jgi:hypothetical protein